MLSSSPSLGHISYSNFSGMFSVYITICEYNYLFMYKGTRDERCSDGFNPVDTVVYMERRKISNSSLNVRANCLGKDGRSATRRMSTALLQAG